MRQNAVGTILREGVHEKEVTTRLSATLAALHAALPGARGPIDAPGRHCMDRARRTIDDPEDLAAFEQAHRALRTKA